MSSVEARVRPRLGLIRVLAACLAIGLSGAVLGAFTPSSSPLLSAAAVTPNLMLLVDDSGSMNSVIRATPFNQALTTWPQVYSCRSDTSCSSLTQLDMTNENLLLSSLQRGGCNSLGLINVYGFVRSTAYNSTVYCLKLPDPVPGYENTRYSARYISYLISILPAGTTSKDYTDGSIPNDYRINVARTAATAIVTANRALRIGLATYNPPASGDSGPGGYIPRPIADLQATTNTTTAQANSNYNALLNSISGLGAVANTPLAETYYEVTRYMRGLTPFYNSTPSTYTSPIQYRCQKNYGVVITDGLPTYDRTFPANDPAYTTSPLVQKLPNWDNKNNDGDDLNGDGEGDTLYLDDVAKFAYDIDMRSNGTDLAGKSWDADDFKQQNMLTYTVGFTSVQDMLSDAATYGHGTYYQANDAASLATALNSALSNITSKSGSGGGAASDSDSLTNSSTYFASSYDPTDWRGTITSYPLATNGTVSAKQNWSTDNTVTPGTTASVFQSWNNLGNAAISLAFNNFSPLQKITLNANLPTGITGDNLVEWAKGTNRTGLRTRSVLLGDIIDSSVVYAAPTDHTATDSTTDNSYSSYLITKAANMNPQLLVNANDGFTNVINPSNGARRYAYMPSSALAQLNNVADPSYVNGAAHTFLNDGQINVVDVQIGGSWKTIALTGVGSGGKSFSAIQLFDGSVGNVIQALWEQGPTSNSNLLTLAAFANLGYAYAKPEVARLQDGRWAAFIANGYGSTNGKASLFVVDVSNGSLIREIVVDALETDNGLSSVKLAMDANSTVIAAYGGDLKGRMWKFDLSAAAPTSWGLAFSGKPLFTAPSPSTQPITAQPYLLKMKTGERMVFFGTGKFLETVDKTTTYPQGFYAVRDVTGGTGNYTIANLTAQAITGSFISSGATYMTSSSNTVDYTSKVGWYLPLTYGSSLVGERVIYAATYSYGRIVFTTAGVDISDPCSSSGFGRFVVLDAISGGMLTTATIDTNGDGVVGAGDLASSGTVTNNSYIGSTTLVISPATASSAETVKAIGQATDNTQPSTTLAGAGGSNRVMWRQIQ